MKVIDCCFISGMFFCIFIVCSPVLFGDVIPNLMKKADHHLCSSDDKPIEAHTWTWHEWENKNLVPKNMTFTKAPTGVFKVAKKFEHFLYGEHVVTFETKLSKQDSITNGNPFDTLSDALIGYVESASIVAVPAYPPVNRAELEKEFGFEVRNVKVYKVPVDLSSRFFYISVSLISFAMLIFLISIGLILEFKIKCQNLIIDARGCAIVLKDNKTDKNKVLNDDWMAADDSDIIKFKWSWLDDHAHVCYFENKTGPLGDWISAITYLDIGDYKVRLDYDWCIIDEACMIKAVGDGTVDTMQKVDKMIKEIFKDQEFGIYQNGFEIDIDHEKILGETGILVSPPTITFVCYLKSKKEKTIDEE